MEYVVVVLFSAAVFAAVILYLALNQDQREKWLGFTFFISSIGGICIYGTAHAFEATNLIAAIFETVVDVGRMFAGINNVGAFEKMVGADSKWMIPFWIVHFLAYYSLASAIIMAVAKGMLKKIRTFFLHINDVELIYGITENSLTYGRNLSGNDHTSIVYVGTNANGKETQISQMGGLLFADSKALNPDVSFLHRLSVKRGKSKFRLCALSNNIDENLDYAVKVLRALEKAKVRPEQTEVILYGYEEHNGDMLQAIGDRYGYGTVRVFDKAELLARLLMQKYPICDAISFDEKGKATCDTNVLLIGFGRKGQELLEKIIINGQFEGSNFKVKVFDSHGRNTDGFFRARFSTLLDNYDISFENADGRSRELALYLEENIEKLRYIAVTVGDDRMGREIAMNILEFMRTRGINLPVYQCCSDCIAKFEVGKLVERYSLFDANILYTGTMDDLAKKLNHYYMNNSASPKKNWADCSYFDRMSSRASADYQAALQKRLGVCNGQELPGEVLENLAKSEHLRWNAFYYASGYTKMDMETFKKRASQAKENSKLRPSKDTEKKRHICLVTWEELDEISECESSLSGKEVDYKQKDRNNVLVIKGLLEK
ncbi:hypothetical protein [Butyrivibrio sp. VCB2006]|uniref:hypothetical protein n=1 Tax=Butyrivibrio sp. VCB2006 TaxID=1280679 RepID=UPI0004144370|nr:hypothetical protein [Butyrivibrio sp. VCB2006]